MTKFPPFKNLIILLTLVLVLAGLLMLVNPVQKVGGVTASADTALTRSTGFENLVPQIKQALIDAQQYKNVTGAIVGGILTHHLPTGIPLQAEFYTTLKQQSPDLKTVVIIGPDHRSKSGGNLSISLANYQTPFGNLKNNQDLSQALVATKLIKNDETPFDGEHSINAHVLFLSDLFPNVQIVPIVVRSSITPAEAQTFGQKLGELLPKDSIVIASCDFSHYLTADQARPLDEASAGWLQIFDPVATRNVQSDSTQTLILVTSAMKAAGAGQFDLATVTNSADLGETPDNTTGYVVGFYTK